MVGAIASFSLMAIGGREAARQLDTFEIMFYRSLIGLLLIVGGAIVLRRLTEVRTQRLPLHIVRNLFHFSAQNLWFYGLTMIPLAPLLLGERTTAWRLIAAALGFAGILSIAQPGLQA